jgi:SAM-dependent methyltransferase
MNEQYQYARYLLESPRQGLKRFLDVQAPFRWHIRHLRPGFVLDIGCGIGRNLAHLKGDGVGIDINPYCVEIARAKGFEVFEPREFDQSEYNLPSRFDSILVSHVLEHMTLTDGNVLLRERLLLLRSGGQLILIAPQEAGYRADPTHIEFMDFAKLQGTCQELGLVVTHQYSFPFPRQAGRFFRYNEFVVIAKKLATD